MSTGLLDYFRDVTDPRVERTKLRYRPIVCGFLEKGLSCDIVFSTKNTDITGDSSHAEHYIDGSA